MQNVNPCAVLTRTTSRLTSKSPLLAAIFAVALGVGAPQGSVALAQSDNAKPHCVKVGGAFVTNFIAPDLTAGTATGDLKGALGVKLLGAVSGSIGDGKLVVLKVQHFWVTETGDTVHTDVAEITAYPGASPSQPLLYSFVYEQAVKITGGTGKFDGATGLTKAWGAVDLGGTGEVTGRYSGTVCFKAPGKP